MSEIWVTLKGVWRSAYARTCAFVSIFVCECLLVRPIIDNAYVQRALEQTSLVLLQMPNTLYVVKCYRRTNREAQLCYAAQCGEKNYAIHDDY